MELFDDHRFAEFCRKRELVPEKYLSFYIRWIKRFFLLEGERRRGAEKDEDRLLLFMEDLRADGSVEAWQQDQAQRAMELYLNVYLKEGTGREGGRISNHEQGVAKAWERAGETPAVHGRGRQDAVGTEKNQAGMALS